MVRMFLFGKMDGLVIEHLDKSQVILLLLDGEEIILDGKHAAISKS